MDINALITRNRPERMRQEFTAFPVPLIPVTGVSAPGKFRHAVLPATGSTIFFRLPWLAGVDAPPRPGSTKAPTRDLRKH